MWPTRLWAIAQWAARLWTRPTGAPPPVPGRSVCLQGRVDTRPALGGSVGTRQAFGGSVSTRIALGGNIPSCSTVELPTTSAAVTAAVAQLRQGYVMWNVASGTGAQATIALNYFVAAAIAATGQPAGQVELGYTRGDGTYTFGYMGTSPASTVTDAVDGVQYPNTVTVGDARCVLKTAHMIGLGTSTPGLVPFAFDYQVWNAFISKQTGGGASGGGDINNVGLFNPYGRTPSELQNGWTDGASVVHSGYIDYLQVASPIFTAPNVVNGYNELRLFPSNNLTPGNSNWLSLDNGNDVTTNAINWWLNGISSGDRTALLAVQGPFSGHLDVLYPISSRDLPGGVGTHHDVNAIDWHGATGIKESDMKSLLNNGVVAGAIGIMPVFAPTSPLVGNSYDASNFSAGYGFDGGGVGTNAYFDIIGYIGMIIGTFADQGGRQGTQLRIQPYGVVPANATFDSVAPAKTSNFSYIFAPPTAFRINYVEVCLSGRDDTDIPITGNVEACD